MQASVKLSISREKVASHIKHKRKRHKSDKNVFIYRMRKVIISLNILKRRSMSYIK